MSNYELLGKHIKMIDARNTESITDRVLGINIDKFFMPSVANVIGTDLSKYKLLTKGVFACNPMHVGRDERLPIALYSEDDPAIVSPAYYMFIVRDESVLDRDYLMMWFRRPEFDRVCWLKTDGSVRGGLSWDDLCRMEIPVPTIDEQKHIVEMYDEITKRINLKRRINDNLRNTLGIANDSMVLFAYDSSGNGNGKEGFAITSDGVYTKSFDYNLTFTPIRDYINISSLKCDGYKLYGYLGEEEYRRLIRIGDIPLPLLTSKMDHAQDDMIEVLYVIRNELKISLNGEPETKEDYVPISEMKMDIGIDDIGADEISIKIAKWFLAVKTNFDKLPWEKVNDIGKVAEFKTDIQSVNILKWKDIIDQYPKATKLSQEQLFYIAPLGKSDKELIVEDYYGEPVFTRTILTDKGIREPYGKICPYSSIERIVIRNMGPKLEYRVFMKGENKFSFPSDFNSLDIMYLCLQVIIEYLNKGRVQILKQDGIEYCPKCFSTNLQSRILVKQCVNCGYKPEIGSDMPKVGYPKWYAQAESVLTEYLYEVLGLEKADANTNNVELDKIEVDRKTKESEKEIITANEDLGAINEKSIEDICYDFLNRVDKNAFIVTEKIQKGLSIPQGEKIILAHDDTLFKNGKNGFAITEKGIYCRGMMENQAAFTSFSEIQNNADKIEWGDKDHYIIKLNGKKLIYFYEQNPVREELMSLILTIANTRL